MNVMPALILSFSTIISAPFIMTEELALQVDAMLEERICSFSKNDFTRYYWYEVIATRDGFLVDTVKVLFAVIEREIVEVIPAAQFPINYEYSDNVKATGLISLGDEKIVDLRCFQ